MVISEIWRLEDSLPGPYRVVMPKLSMSDALDLTPVDWINREKSSRRAPCRLPECPNLAAPPKRAGGRAAWFCSERCNVEHRRRRMILDRLVDRLTEIRDDESTSATDQRRAESARAWALRERTAYEELDSRLASPDDPDATARALEKLGYRRVGDSRLLPLNQSLLGRLLEVDRKHLAADPPQDPLKGMVESLAHACAENRALATWVGHCMSAAAIRHARGEDPTAFRQSASGRADAATANPTSA